MSPCIVYSVIVAALIINAVAREITFPPLVGVQHNFDLSSIDEDLDISVPAFAGLSTFGNLEYVHCLAEGDEHVERYDIAILGAPFDTVGLTVTRF